jgi:parvulin-like peptidyl-prolyl isomerase
MPVGSPGVYRRPLIAVLAGALTIAGVGCSTFSDNDAAARVGSAELSQGMLGDLLIASTPGAQPGDDLDLAGDTARNLLNTWILTRVLEQDLADAGASVDQAATDAAAAALEEADPTRWATTPEILQELQVAQQAAIRVWSELEVATPSDDELRALYATGPVRSGIVCSAHILVETEDEANALLGQLAGGADFAELARTESIDTASGADGGNLPCDLIDNFRSAYVPTFVDAALEGDLGEPVGPVESQFGHHVIVLRSPDAVDPGELAALYNDITSRFRRAADRLDIYVDPRFGAFESDTGVVALG